MFRLKWKPNRPVVRAFKRMFTGSTPAVTELMREVEQECYNFWKANVYTYFDARASLGLSNTGQLGRSLLIRRRNTRLEFFMIPMHNDRTKVTEFFRMPGMSGMISFSPFSMPSMGMGINKDYDYGKLLREGFSCSSQGRYSVKHDCKIEPGYHPGYDANTRWVPWMQRFGDFARDTLAERMTKKMKEAGCKMTSSFKIHKRR